MLKTMVDEHHVSFQQRFDCWQDAIAAGAKTLLEDGTLDQVYVDDIITCIQTYGPYIIIAPFVAMPHSTLGGRGVHKTAISFMKVEEPVVFDPDDPSKDARLFFTLAATENDQHIQNMSALANMLLREGVIEDLLEATSSEDLLKIHQKYDL